MEIIKTEITGLHLVERNPFKDPRGEFSRVFCTRELKPIIGDRNIIQINHSISYKRGSVRGMHFQYHPFMEMKIVRCLQGAILDVVVDLRKGSQTFLQWHAEELSSDNHRMVVVPERFAHGYQTLTNDCEVLYLHTAEYTPTAVGRININDPKLGISWPHPVSEISIPDKEHPYLDDTFVGLEL